MRSISAAMSAPDTSGIVIAGPTGVGKSRIAREAMSAAVSRGYEGRWVVGTSSARAIPLGAFTAWAPSGVTETVQLVRGVIESLTAGPKGAPVVLAVDDAHLLDDLSIFVVQQILQRGAAKVILTVNDGDAITPAVQEIWKVGRFDRLDLGTLTSHETAVLLSATLAGSVDPDAAQRLWRLTRGNMLYLRNIVEQEIASGRIAQQHGFWRWSGDPIIPRDLVALVESRMGDLPAPVSDVVDALAVGEPLELSALTRITDPAAVEDADTRGLIRLEPVAGGVQVRMAHELYGEVRRERAAPTRLRRLRGLVAAELAASDDGDDLRVVVRRATLHLDSDLPPDVDLLVRAAHGAVWLADLKLADRLAEAAVRAGAGPEASFVRAHALSWLGRGEEADAVFAAMPTTGLTDEDHGRYAFLRASNLLWALADPARAKEFIDEASHSALSQARTYIDAFLTVYWFATDQPQAAAQAAENLVLEELPAVVGAEIAWVLSAIAADAGQTSRAVNVAEAGYRVAAWSFDAPHMVFNIADAHISALLLSGRVGEARDVAERVQQQAADLPGAARLLAVAAAGRVCVGAGQIDDACDLLGQAAIGLSASGYALGWGYRYHVPRVTALAMRGSAEAADVLTALDGVRRTFRSLDYERSLARAWVAAAQGAVSEAIAVLVAAAERAATTGQFAAEVLCLQTAAQFGDHSGAARLRELDAIVEGPRVGLAARFAEGLRDGDAAELDSVSEEFERIGDLVAAADAAAHAAITYRRQDKRGSAGVRSARAGALAEQGGNVTTPALRQATDDLPLTDREREIVMLIGGGLLNREAAERLTVSVRTVESHIYRAMAKTGARTREELIALLMPRRPSQ
nr:LuxR C-terminal-related transcriptional regulator [Mycolicibacterium sp. CR10]